MFFLIFFSTSFKLCFLMFAFWFPNQIIYNMVEEYPRNVSQEMAEISIVYGDESLPRLYEHSRISSEQLPGQPGEFSFLFLFLFDLLIV